MQSSPPQARIRSGTRVTRDSPPSAGLELSRGNLEAAQSWLQPSALSADAEPNYFREIEYLTWARVPALAAALCDRDVHALGSIGRFLERMLRDAETKDRWSSGIEILLLLARTRHAQNDHAAAEAAVQRALTHAAPEGFLRVFLEAGTDIQALVQSIQPRQVPELNAYLAKLLPLFETGAPSSSLAETPVPVHAQP